VRRVAVLVRCKRVGGGVRARHGIGGGGGGGGSAGGGAGCEGEVGSEGALTE